MRDGVYIKLRGDRELRRNLKRYGDQLIKDLRKFVSKTATELRRNIKAATPVGETGELRRSIKKSLMRKGAQARVYSKTFYTSFQELGTEHIEEQRFMRDELEKIRPGFKSGSQAIVLAAGKKVTI